MKPTQHDYDTAADILKSMGRYSYTDDATLQLDIEYIARKLQREREKATMKIQVVRIVDDTPMFTMNIASTEAELVDGLLPPEDAYEIASDMVANAADWYDSGQSPWRVEIVGGKLVGDTIVPTHEGGDR